MRIPHCIIDTTTHMPRHTREEARITTDQGETIAQMRAVQPMMRASAEMQRGGCALERQGARQTRASCARASAALVPVADTLRVPLLHSSPRSIAVRGCCS
jgi:hypothetical protein